jgi:hypothetical protein
MSTFTVRINKGWSLEKALTSEVIYGYGAVDHLGNKWRTKSEMLKHYGLTFASFRFRINAGWSLKDALITKKCEKTANAIKCIDHLGNEFNSMTAMCRYYNVSYKAFRERIRSGRSLEQALTDESKSNGYRKRPVDHLGNKYYSYEEMCLAYNISTGTFRARINRGWDLEDALTKPVECQGKNGKKCVDHTGREFDSLYEMCYYNDTTVSRCMSRLHKGQTMEQALSIHKVKDHNGKEFNSLGQMAVYWGLSPDMLYDRLGKGWDLEKALATPKKAQRHRESV